MRGFLTFTPAVLYGVSVVLAWFHGDGSVIQLFGKQRRNLPLFKATC
jgi:hypothetical protein